MYTTPYVALDMDIMEKNINTMVSGLARNNIQHWPHIKTHKSVRLAKLEQQLGASGITCAKLSEAEVMAEGGITSILLAYPLIGEDKCQRFADLARKITIRTIIDSVAGAEGLSKAAVKMICSLMSISPLILARIAKVFSQTSCCLSQNMSRPCPAFKLPVYLLMPERFTSITKKQIFVGLRVKKQRS